MVYYSLEENRSRINRPHQHLLGAGGSEPPVVVRQDRVKKRAENRNFDLSFLVVRLCENFRANNANKCGKHNHLDCSVATPHFR